MKNKEADRQRAERRAAVIKALAHPSRILLAEAMLDGDRCVSELRDLAGTDISTISKHLTVMKSAGLVVSEKRGLHQFYRLRCPCLTDFFRCVDLLNSSGEEERATKIAG